MRKNRQKVAAGIATTTIVEPLLLLSHQGGTGVIIGLGLGLAAYLGADEIQDWRERHGFRSEAGEGAKGLAGASACWSGAPCARRRKQATPTRKTWKWTRPTTQ